MSTPAGSVSNTTDLIDYPNVDSPSCQLLGPTALVVQALMGVLVILSLVYKRHREKPMRPWRIWVFDVSKQIFGQMFVHGLNVLISGVISDVTSGNACVSYFLNILIDTTFGVAVIYGALHALTWLFSDVVGLKGFESGVYGNPPSLRYWLRQASTYVVALTTMKVVVIALLVLFPGIFNIGEWLLSWTWTGEGDHFQVIFVMGIFPIVMNIVQFWLIDSIVKASSGPLVLESDAEDPGREPLFNAPSDDEDDGNYHHSRGDIENQISTHPSHFSLDSGRHSRAKSYSTGITTPDPEQKSGEAQDQHAYPPSLSGSHISASMSSSQSKSFAKNHVLRSTRLTHSTSRSESPSNALRRPRSATNPVISTSDDITHDDDEWAVSWDEGGESGWRSLPSVDSKINGRGLDSTISQPQRIRRLS